MVVFKEYVRVRGVIADAAKLPEITDASKLKELTIPHLMLFIEMRTTKKCATRKGKPVYFAEATSLFGEDSRLALGSVPDGFAEWQASQASVAAETALPAVE